MGARRLILLRHGQAESADLWAEDFERPLTRRGIEEVREMAARLKRRGWVPDIILASPAERTWTTAQIVADICELADESVRCERELYLASPDGVWQTVSRQKPAFSHILLCGHNPSLSALASRFGPKQQRRELSTAATASAFWPDGHWDSISPRSALRCDLDDPDRADE